MRKPRPDRSKAKWTGDSLSTGRKPTRRLSRKPWIATKGKCRREKKGHAVEKGYIRRWKETSFANLFLLSIRGSDVATWRDKRLEEVSPNSVCLELALLSYLFTIAIKEWGMEGLVNPVQRIRKPKLPQERGRRLKSGELERILSECEIYGGDIGPVVLFALETGMRRAEIAGMTWNHVELKKKTVTLPETKNGEKRIVPLSTEAVRILSSLPRRIDGRVWALGDPNSIAKAFIRVLTRTRAAYENEFKEKKTKPDPGFLTDLTFHDRRHEATSRFFEKGLNPMQVAAITGHKTLQMLTRYTHMKAEDLAELQK